MSLSISAVRIRNFRSLFSADFGCSSLGTVLIGANNVGKTALLSALRLVFDMRLSVSSEDIFRFPKDGIETIESREAIIDVLLSPLKTNLETDSFLEFSSAWQRHFGKFISFDKDGNQAVCIRAKVIFNSSKGDFEVERRIMIDWPDVDQVMFYDEFHSQVPREAFFDALPVFYLDARRDIVADMKDRFSYFARLLKDIKIKPATLIQFESDLEKINSEIVKESDVLQHLTTTLELISTTLNNDNSKILIHPVTQKVNDLGKNLVINFQDEDSEIFPISNHGMGTRSWITFLTLLSYVEWQINLRASAQKCYYPIILLEEPEAHLHPNSQRNIYKQIKSLKGQVFVSTHSPSIVSQTEPEEILYISKNKGKTIAKALPKDFTKEETRKLKFEILKSRGELMFSEAFILCEGETEEQALPIFFKEHFEKDLYEIGINIISVGGSGKYKPFLKLAKCFDIPAYIFSDGEKEAIKDVKKAVTSIYGSEKELQMEKVTFLDHGHNFEEYLIFEGYIDELVASLENEKGLGILDEFIETKQDTVKRRKKTEEICPTCTQNIFEPIKRDYKVKDGRNKALLDCLEDNKTAYSSTIADYIIEMNKEDDKKIPSKIREHFRIIEKCSSSF